MESTRKEHKYELDKLEQENSRINKKVTSYVLEIEKLNLSI